MRLSVSDSDDSGNCGFQKIVNGFLLQPGLPFSTVLTAEKVNRIFRKHGGLFGENGIYSIAVVLWAFLGQVLRDGKEACARLHHLRRADFRKGRRIGKYDHIIVGLGRLALNGWTNGRTPRSPKLWNCVTQS